MSGMPSAGRKWLKTHKRARLVLFLLGTLISLEAALIATDSAIGPLALLRNGFYTVEMNKTMPAFYRENFCDPMHFTDAGETLIARCLGETYPRLFQKPKRVWLLGGSTTAGGRCGDVNSRNWGARLGSSFPDLEIVNLAEGGMNSDHTLSILRRSDDRPPADLIISVDGINEILTYRDERDPNYQEISRLVPGIEASRASRGLLTGYVWLLRSLRTAYERVHVFRALCNVAKYALNRVASIALATAIHQLGDGDSDEDGDRSEEPLSSMQIYSILDRKSTEYGLANYRINMRKLQEYARKHRAELVILSLPEAPDVFLPDNPKANAAFYNWVRLYHLENQVLARTLGLKHIDVRACFQQAAREAARRN